MTRMSTSNHGIVALMVSEGVVIAPYLDSVGVWTIGVGHTTGAGAPDPKDYLRKEITLGEAMAIFSRDLKKFEDAANRLIKVPVLQHEFDAIIHFMFNIGQTGFARSKLLKNLNAGRKNDAFQSGFHGWLKPKELLSRRNKERLMALHGQYGSTLVPVYRASNNRPVLWQTMEGADLLVPVSKPTIPVPTPAPAPKPAQPVQPESFFTWLLRKLGFTS